MRTSKCVLQGMNPVGQCVLQGMHPVVCLLSYFNSLLCVTGITLTHSLMEPNPSWEAANCAATKEFPSILWNPKVHDHVHNRPPPVPILGQIDPVHTTPSYLSKILLILSTPLHLGLPSGLFPSGIPTNILYVFLFSPPFVLHVLPISSSLTWSFYLNLA
jgi:hypothetical protein